MSLDLTLCVPVRDRHYNLYRIKEHFKDLDCRKIIIDTSRAQYSDKEGLKDYGFEYIYLGPMTYPESRYKMTGMVETKYVLDCADDDLHVLSSMRRGVEFLDQNDDYSVCYGEELWFDGERTYNKIPDIHAHALTSQYYSDDPIDRMTFNCIPMTGAAHCLYRTNLLHNINKLIYENTQLHPIGWAEPITNILASIEGNKKYLACVWNLRHPGDRLIDKLPEEELQMNEPLGDNLDVHHLMPIFDIISEKTGLDATAAFDVLKDTLKKSNDKKYCQSFQGPSRSYEYHKGSRLEVLNMAASMARK